MSDERQIDVEESPVVKDADTVVPYSRFQEWQRRRATRLVPTDQPPANEAVVLPVATPTHDR